MTRRTRSIRLACAVSAACLLGVAPSARAGVPHTPFTVTPVAASTSSPITATWKVDRGLRRGERFGFELTVVPTGTAGTAGTTGTGWTDAGYNCAWTVEVAPRVIRKGSTLRATFRPNAGVHGLLERPRTWCPGTARVVLFRYPFAGDTSTSRFLGLRKVPITLAPGETIPFPQPSVKVTLLPGSTVTATAAGRPDRSTPVTGVLRGVLETPIRPDVHVASLAGALRPASFAPDPLCPGTTPPATFDVAPGTRLDVTGRGPATFGLNLSGGPSQLFGCGAPGGLAGTTTLNLTGTFGREAGLGAVPLAGSAPGFALPDGTQGGLAANLVLNIDISGRG